MARNDVMTDDVTSLFRQLIKLETGKYVSCFEIMTSKVQPFLY